MRIDPLLTASPVTGAVRHLTDVLLKEVYLAPLGKPFALQNLLTGDQAPWSESFSAAPAETIAAVEDVAIDAEPANLDDNLEEQGTPDPAAMVDRINEEANDLRDGIRQVGKGIADNLRRTCLSDHSDDGIVYCGDEKRASATWSIEGVANQGLRSSHAFFNPWDDIRIASVANGGKANRCSCKLATGRLICCRKWANLYRCHVVDVLNHRCSCRFTI
mgnify:CR=1 FL=1